MSIIVFISHSTKPKKGINSQPEDQLRAQACFLNELSKCLRANQAIDVVTDEIIPPGKSWRDFLFGGAAECHAAIILVNEQALCHSPWVDTEVKILYYRKYTEGNDFCFLMLPLGNIDANRIAKHTPWEAINPGELQMLLSQGLDVNDKKAVEKVIRKLAGILKELDEASNTNTAWLVRRLCALLDFSVENLKILGNSLGINLAGITNEFAVRRRVALSIYHMGPKAISHLKSMPFCRLDNEAMQDILDIVNTGWIDMTASVGLLTCCKKNTARRVVAINGGDSGYTPQAYIRQVCNLNKPWHIILLDPNQDVFEQISEELINRFENILRKSPKYRTMNRSEKIAFLNSVFSIEDAAPVFITFLQNGGGSVHDIIDSIFDKFPGFRVIVCTGTDPGNAVLSPDIFMLKPELSRSTEAKARQEYLAALTQL